MLLVVISMLWSVLFIGAAFALATSTLTQMASLAVGLTPLALLFWTRRTAPVERDRLVAAREREAAVLRVLQANGPLSTVDAALAANLTVAETDAVLSALAGAGYLTTVDDGDGPRYRLVRLIAPATVEPATSVAHPTVAAAHTSALAPVEPLSARELEVLALLAAGRSNKEIARALHVTEGTVKTHTNNLYRKLGARNRTEAVVYARDLGLVTAANGG
jgi:DNA-binding NarL/FixJ family response regulator